MQEIKKINLSLEFETIKISHFVDDMKNGGTPRRSVSKYWENGTIPWLKTGEINNSPILDNSEYITEEGLKKSSAKVLPINSVIMALYGKGTAGRVGLLKFEATTNQACCAMICKDRIKSEYLYYYLLSIQPQIELLANGSVQQNLSKEILADYDINVPKNYQDLKNIVWILKNIDQKIENNKSINKNLEQLSQILFKKWLIDFDLKNEFSISEPFKESNLGKIPESWEIKTIGDLSDVKGRIGWRGYTTNDLVDDGPWVVGGKEITSGFIDFNSAKHLTREKYEESPEIMLKDKDLIIAKTGTIGPIAMFYEIYGDATLNPNVGLIRSKMIAPALLLTFFKTPRAQYYLNEFTTSSVQPAINQTTIKQLEVAIPSDKQLLEKIGNKFEEINLLQFNLNEEIKKLQKLRDTLLPKLMSGEIDVSEVNCDLELKYNYMKYLFNQIHTPMSKSVV